MGRRNDRWEPPARGGKSPTEPVEAIDLYPNPLPPPRPPETRETILADLQTGFAALTGDELKVAQLWIYGRSVSDVCHFLKLDETAVRKLWKRMRRKLREALVAGSGRMPPAPHVSEHLPLPESSQEAGDTASP